MPRPLPSIKAPPGRGSLPACGGPRGFAPSRGVVRPLRGPRAGHAAGAGANPRTPRRPGRGGGRRGRRGSLPRSRCFVRRPRQRRRRTRTDGAGGDGDVKGCGVRAGRGEPRGRRVAARPPRAGRRRRRSPRGSGAARLPRAKVTQQRSALAISPETGTEGTAGSALTPRPRPRPGTACSASAQARAARPAAPRLDHASAVREFTLCPRERRR